jgi:hypothetical protein
MITLNELRHNVKRIEEAAVNDTPPAMLLLKRKAVRVFPNGERVALYYAPNINKYISIPYDSKGRAVITNVQEEHLQTLDEALKYSLSEGWLKHKDNTYSTDAAEWSHHVGKIHCPKCKAELHHHLGNPQKDREGEVTHWNKHCACGAHMKIFNDHYEPQGNQLTEAKTKTKVKPKAKAKAPTKKAEKPKATNNMELLKHVAYGKPGVVFRFKSDDKAHRTNTNTARAILDVHNRLSKENQQKLKALVHHSKRNFEKVSTFALGATGGNIK